MSYDAFISYSHAADGRLAPALKKGLERLGRGWSQVRALHVFRDETDLSATPDLWSTITAAMDEAQWLVLLVAPAAASSKWVNREIDYWCEGHEAERILIALTEGSLRWDTESGDFN